MELEVQLAHPHRRRDEFRAGRVEELCRRRQVYGRRALEGARAVRGGDHLPGRAAASVAEPERNEGGVRPAFVGEVLFCMGQLGAREHRIIGVDRREVREDARAVDPLPEEGVMRKPVRLVPRDLLREEVFGTGGPRDLRQRGGVAERVGQPHLAGMHTELLHEEPRALDELPHERFAPDQVRVRFDPHAADRHEPAFGHADADALEEFGIEPLHPCVLLRRRRREHEVVVLVHQVEHVRERPRDLADRLAHRPQPRRVDVRVADGEDAVGARHCGGFQRRAESRAAVRGGGGDIERVDRIDCRFERREQLGAARRGRRQLKRQALQGPDVLDELPHLAVALHDLDPAQGVKRVRRGCRLASELRRPELDEATADVRVRGRFDEHLEVLAGRRVQAHVPVERLDGLEDAAVTGEDEALGLEPGLRAGEAEVDDQFDFIRFGSPVGRNRTGHPEPDRSPGPAPRLPDRERRERIGDGLRERHRLIRHFPRFDSDGCTCPLDRRHQPFPHQSPDALLDCSRRILTGHRRSLGFRLHNGA